MNLKRYLIPLLLFLSFNTHSQLANFKYWKELCDCNAKFDSSLYSREQLQNTFDYLWWAPNIDSDVTAWALDKIDDLNVAELKRECIERTSILNSLEFVNDTFWLQLKDERIKYYESTCRLSEVTVLAYSNPDTLLSYDLVDSSCVYYRNLLIKGGQAMIDAWVKYEEDWVKKNGYIERNQREFRNKYNSPYREDYARLELMMYGWWNSANHILPHVNTSYNYAKEFERLLSNVECECDEP